MQKFNKRIIIQILLFLIIVLFIGLFFFKYFFKNKTENSFTEKKPPEIYVENTSNIINDIEYNSTDNLGNRYIIKAAYGKIMSEGDNIILMNNVEAFIFFTDNTKINIVSDEAIYNIFNYDTNFIKNISVNNMEQNLTCDNVDLLFKDHKIQVYNNIIYKNLDTKFSADRIEIDLLTKNSKIYMNNKNKKIKIVHKNVNN